MLKLKFQLDPKNANQMLALSRFAATLAGSAEIVVAPASVQEEAVDPATVTNEEADEAPAPTPAPEEKPKRRKRRTKAEIEAEKQEDEAEEAESEEAEEVEDAAPKTSKITLDDIRRAVAEKKDKHLQIMKFKLKEDFGVTKTPDLKPEQYEAFYNFVNGLA